MNEYKEIIEKLLNIIYVVKDCGALLDEESEQLATLVNQYYSLLKKEKNNNNCIISIDELYSLLKCKAKLTILDNDGVDNWEWYMQGCDDYIAKYFNISPLGVRANDLTLDDVVSQEIQKYKIGE